VKRAVAAACLVIGVCARALAHDPNAAPITWNREISRIVFERCVSCHRQGGSSFSLMTYQEAQPRANAIKESVLSRRMPPWGAVKGFGSFQNDEGLTQQQIELVADWVEGGITRGNNPKALPPPPKFEAHGPFELPNTAFAVTDGLVLDRAITIVGVYPEHVPPTASMQIVASLPNGDVEPLIWLYQFDDRYKHPFLYRKPLQLPAMTVIRGVAASARILVIPRTEVRAK
jgi:mono/diheme cytochrome c family protein